MVSLEQIRDSRRALEEREIELRQLPPGTLEHPQLPEVLRHGVARLNERREALTRLSPEEEARLLELQGELGATTLAKLGINATPGRETHVVPTAPGFQVWVEVSGAKGGYPVFILHGMPSSRVMSLPEEYAEETGVRLISYDRPGYGLSPALPGMKPFHSAVDIHAIAEYFGLKEYGILGGSGGAAHALGAAAVLSETRRVAALAPVSPLNSGVEDWHGRMAKFNRRLLKKYNLPANRDLHSRLFTTLAITRDHIFRDPAFFFNAALADAGEHGNPDNPPSTHTMEEALRYSLIGWMTDILNHADWEFDLRGIQKDLLIAYGAQDMFSPPQHGRWLAGHIPGATGIELDAGHSEVVAGAIELAALDWLQGIGPIPTGHDMFRDNRR